MKRILYLILLLLIARVQVVTPSFGEMEVADSKVLQERQDVVQASITPLMTAAQEGDLKQLQDKLEESGTSINAQDAHGRTAMYYAAMANKPEIIQALLEVSSIDVEKPDHDDVTPLGVAIELNNVEAVNALLDACAKKSARCPYIEFRDKKGYTPLMKAAQTGNEAIIKHLLDAGANPLAQVKLLNTETGKDVQATALDIADKRDNKDAAQRLQVALKSYADRTIEFNQAARKRDIEKAQKLLAEGIDVNMKDKNGQTPVYHAMNGSHRPKPGQIELIKKLLDSGANVNALISGRTALHWAGILRSPEVVNLLIEYKADPNIADASSGAIALHDAALDGAVQIIPILLNAGSNVNKRNKEGFTPLMNAVHNGHEEIVKLLLKAKADPNIAANSGQSPLLVAGLKNNTKIMKLLKDAGAQ